LVAFAVLVLLAHPVCLLTHDVKCNPAVTWQQSCIGTYLCKKMCE
jgi:hypothetical protein